MPFEHFDNSVYFQDDPTIVIEVTGVKTVVASEVAIAAMPSLVDLPLVLLSMETAMTVMPTPITSVNPHCLKGFGIRSVSTSSLRLLSLFPQKTELMNFLSPASKIFSASFFPQECHPQLLYQLDVNSSGCSIPA